MPKISFFLQLALRFFQMFKQFRYKILLDFIHSRDAAMSEIFGWKKTVEIVSRRTKFFREWLIICCQNDEFGKLRGSHAPLSTCLPTTRGYKMRRLFLETSQLIILSASDICQFLKSFRFYTQVLSYKVDHLIDFNIIFFKY